MSVVSSVLLDLVLPPRCAACLRPGAGLCAACLREAHRLRLPGCQPVRLAADVIAVAAFRYDGVIAQAVRTVKRPGRHDAATHLGTLLWTEVDAAVPGIAAWPRTWVPSTRSRLRHRGADIPGLLAGRRAVPMLRRIRQRSDQTEMSAAQRRTSPTGDFVCGHPVPRRVVLVDDVRTTGGTALAAAAALVQAGARRVILVTLAAVDDPRGHASRGR